MNTDRNRTSHSSRQIAVYGAPLLDTPIPSPETAQVLASILGLLSPIFCSSILSILAKYACDKYNKKEIDEQSTDYP